MKLNRPKNRDHRAWWEFKRLAVWMQDKFLWSVQTTNGCSAPLSQCRNSSNASFTASNSVTNIIVMLSRYQPARKKGTEVNLLIRSRALGLDRPHPCVRRVDLHDELPGGVRLDKNGGRREKSFKTREGSLHLRCPGKWEARSFCYGKQ